MNEPCPGPWTYDATHLCVNDAANNLLLDLAIELTDDQAEAVGPLVASAWSLRKAAAPVVALCRKALADHPLRTPEDSDHVTGVRLTYGEAKALVDAYDTGEPPAEGPTS